MRRLITFDSDGETLVGTLDLPDTPAPSVDVATETAETADTTPAAALAARVDDAAGWAGVVLVGGVVLALVVTVAGSRRPTD